MCAFLQRLAPNGQQWKDYCATAPPAGEGGRLTGAWGECMNAAVIFEFTNEGWEEMPGYEDGPAGQVIEFCDQRGFSPALLESGEEEMRQEMQNAQSDPLAFLSHRARNGKTWKEYCRNLEPTTDRGGFVNGAWGECLTAAVIFEHQNPNWDRLPAYMADGPAGQVINFFLECGHDPFEEALTKTEEASHEAFDQQRPLPVFEDVYQAVIGSAPAAHVNEPPPRMTGRKKALLCGCNYKGTRAELRGCINDAHAWKDLLMQEYGFQLEDMVILTDDQADPSKTPTKQNMRSGLQWLVAGAEPGDVLFWQFSGHGTQQESRSQNEADGMDEALCPTDYSRAGVIIDDEIFDLAVLPLQSGVKLTIILDCCHSGTAVDLPFIWHESGGWEEVGGTVYTAGDVQMFSGCEDDQCSMDVSVQGRAAGAMTSCMTRAIRENPDWNYPDLLVRLHEILGEGGYEQKPRLTSSQQFNPQGKRFSLCEGAIPNQNERLGSTGPPRLQPARPQDKLSMLGDMGLFGAMIFG